MPRHPAEYGNLLRELIAEHGVACWLVNTGWTGGAYGVGRRMPIKATRALARRGARRLARRRRIPHRPEFRLCRAVGVSAASTALSSIRARPGPIKLAYDRQAQPAGRHVHRQFRQVRGPRRCNGARCGPEHRPGSRVAEPFARRKSQSRLLFCPSLGHDSERGRDQRWPPLSTSRRAFRSARRSSARPSSALPGPAARTSTRSPPRCS